MGRLKPGSPSVLDFCCANGVGIVGQVGFDLGAESLGRRPFHFKSIVTHAAHNLGHLENLNNGGIEFLVSMPANEMRSQSRSAILYWICIGDVFKRGSGVQITKVADWIVLLIETVWSAIFEI